METEVAENTTEQLHEQIKCENVRVCFNMQNFLKSLVGGLSEMSSAGCVSAVGRFYL